MTHKEGQMVPLPPTLEIKTDVGHRPLAFGDVVPQLWISQTLKLVRACRTKGVFVVLKVGDVAVGVSAWEDGDQKDLELLAGLIGKSRDVVKDSGRRSILKYNANEDNLVFDGLKGDQILARGMYAK